MLEMTFVMTDLGQQTWDPANLSIWSGIPLLVNYLVISNHQTSHSNGISHKPINDTYVKVQPNINASHEIAQLKFGAGEMELQTLADWYC